MMRDESALLIWRLYVIVFELYLRLRFTLMLRRCICKYFVIVTSHNFTLAFISTNNYVIYFINQAYLESFDSNDDNVR